MSNIFDFESPTEEKKTLGTKRKRPLKRQSTLPTTLPRKSKQRRTIKKSSVTPRGTITPRRTIKKSSIKLPDITRERQPRAKPRLARLRPINECSDLKILQKINDKSCWYMSVLILLLRLEYIFEELSNEMQLLLHNITKNLNEYGFASRTVCLKLPIQIWKHYQTLRGKEPTSTVNITDSGHPTAFLLAVLKFSNHRFILSQKKIPLLSRTVLKEIWEQLSDIDTLIFSRSFSNNPVFNKLVFSMPAKKQSYQRTTSKPEHFIDLIIKNFPTLRGGILALKKKDKSVGHALMFTICEQEPGERKINLCDTSSKSKRAGCTIYDNFSDIEFEDEWLLHNFTLIFPRQGIIRKLYF